MKGEKALLFVSTFPVLTGQDKEVLLDNIGNLPGSQGCGSGMIFFGSGSGSGSDFLDYFGSGSGSGSCFGSCMKLSNIFNFLT